VALRDRHRASSADVHSEDSSGLPWPGAKLLGCPVGCGSLGSGGL
jgi:hypothetical protein